MRRQAARARLTPAQWALARLTDETVLARMFAGFEAILTLGVALGGLLAPLVIEGLGARLALVAR